MKVLSLILKKVGIVDKFAFYEGKKVTEVEWWLSYCSGYPDLTWARLRVFSDGSADAAFEEAKVYGFDNREYASSFLAEDEYMRFDSMDEEDARNIGAKKADIVVPTWHDQVSPTFEYLGTY